MNKSHSRWLLLGLCVLSGCGQDTTESSRTSIYQGVEDSGHEAVGLLIRNGKKWCSATLVAPKIALSAGHCFEGKSEKPESLVIQFNGGSLSSRISSVVVHPKYSDWFGRVTNDLAVLYLDDAPSIAPIAVASSVPTKGESVLLVGYGYKDALDLASFDGTKRTGTNVIGSVEEKKIFFPKPTDLATSQVCKGDSGGPIFATRGDRLELIGIVSGSADPRSSKTCQVEAYGARIDAYQDWLEPLLFSAPDTSILPPPDEAASTGPLSPLSGAIEGLPTVSAPSLPANE